MVLPIFLCQRPVQFFPLCVLNRGGPQVFSRFPHSSHGLRILPSCATFSQDLESRFSPWPHVALFPIDERSLRSLYVFPPYWGLFFLLTPDHSTINGPILPIWPMISYWEPTFPLFLYLPSLSKQRPFGHWSSFLVFFGFSPIFNRLDFVPWWPTSLTDDFTFLKPHPFYDYKTPPPILTPRPLAKPYFQLTRISFLLRFFPRLLLIPTFRFLPPVQLPPPRLKPQELFLFFLDRNPSNLLSPHWGSCNVTPETGFSKESPPKPSLG